MLYRSDTVLELFTYGSHIVFTMAVIKSGTLFAIAIAVLVINVGLRLWYVHDASCTVHDTRCTTRGEMYRSRFY